MQQHIVKPSKVDTKENEENILSEQITTETSLTDDLVKNSGVPLEAAIKQVIKVRIVHQVHIILYCYIQFGSILNRVSRLCSSFRLVQSIFEGKVFFLCEKE